MSLGRLEHRGYWIEIYLDEKFWYEPYIELPNQAGVICLSSAFTYFAAINEAKKWIDQQVWFPE